MSGFHKMLQVREPTIIRLPSNGPEDDILLLDGIGRQRGQPLEKLDCIWLPGKKGKGPGYWLITKEVAYEFIKRGVPANDIDGPVPHLYARAIKAIIEAKSSEK